MSENKCAEHRKFTRGCERCEFLGSAPQPEGHSESSEYKKGYRDGLEQGIFDGQMDRNRAEFAEQELASVRPSADGKWISVEDRLPENDKRVLVLRSNEYPRIDLEANHKFEIADRLLIESRHEECRLEKQITELQAELSQRDEDDKLVQNHYNEGIEAYEKDLATLRAELSQVRAAFQKFHENLPDGEYVGLGELRMAMKWKPVASSEQTREHK